MIILKTPQEIEKMRVSGRMVAEILEELKKAIKPDVSTEELDRLAERRITSKGAIPAFKGYRGFPKSLCISLNEEVVHGIPSRRKIKEGDIVSIDLGVLFQGFYGDAAITVPVGKISLQGQRLLEVTERALWVGIEQAEKGRFVSDISHSIQSFVECCGFSVVRAFVGHGMGASLHEDPQVPNFGLPGRGPRIKEGMVLAIEPMVNQGCSEVEILEDKWTVVTADRTLSAHFEHTIAITHQGVEILSLL